MSAGAYCYPSAVAGAAPHRFLTQLLARAPEFCELAALPTPIEPLGFVSAQAWIKRDDLSSALYGGGKTRKLEWLLASDRFAGDLLSVGATGSHHLTACALHMSSRGSRLHAICFPQPVDDHVRENLGVLASLGVEFVPIGSRLGFPVGWLRARLRVSSRRLPFLAAGGSTPLGCLGYVEAGLELAEQIRCGLAPQPKVIYVACGTMGTAAGLTIGLALGGVATHVRAVAVVERAFVQRASFAFTLRRIDAELRRRGLRERDSLAKVLARASTTWSIEHGQIGSGYARPSEGSRAAVQLAAAHGLRLEATYTGKCLAAMLADFAGERPRLGGPALFWNTHASNDLRPLLVPGWESRLPPTLARGLDG